MRVRYILDGNKSRGNPQTLSLCLTWIPIHSDINRCLKYLSREGLTFLTVVSCRLFCIEYPLYWIAQWAEEHLLGLNWISPLKKPLSAVGMSCKVQVKSSSQWECNSLLGETMSLLVPLILFYVHTYAMVQAFPCFGFVIQAYCTINWPLSLLHARCSYFWFLCTFCLIGN